MAASSLFALLDDIASVMDDVAVLSKVAAKKTSGVLGDDLALNAHQVSGVASNRELPVVYQVAKGSFKNKVIIIPSALLISAYMPWAITPLLIGGGVYLCFEGVEKIAHSIFPHTDDGAKQHQQLLVENNLSEEELLLLEKDKIKGAIRTDFILSAEIIVIALGVVTHFPILTRSLVLSLIGLLMTVGVYGLVAFLVKIDDFGLYLIRKNKAVSFGHFLLKAAPYLMKSLSVAGTVAMFLVGGGILVHGITFFHEFFHHQFPSLTLGVEVLSNLYNGLVGFMAGVLTLIFVKIFMRIKKFISA